VDVVIVNGHIYPQVDSSPELRESYRQRPIVLRNDDGRLVDVSREAGPGMQVSASARGLAVGDHDDDGDLDLLITAMDAPPLLLRNDTPQPGHWVKLRLLNRHGGPSIGARAVFTSGGKSQTRELRSGSSYQSQNAMELHVGLDKATKVDLVEIFWGGGRKTALRDVAANRTHTIRDASP
jgi:hypothetical protein